MADVKPEFPQLYSALDLKQAEQPRWLAKGRLPRAAISLLVGDEGIGKSLLWVWIVAAITRGLALPEFGIPARAPAHVIVVATEDDWSTTVRPRLEVAGADLALVSVICTEDDGSGAPLFPRDLYLIVDADPPPALIVVDAWLDTVPSNLSVKDPQQARRALHPWKEVATATDAAVMLLTHTNRVDSGNARDKYGATGELRKKARMTLFAQRDEDDNLTVGPEKANTTAPVPASVFTIDGIQHFDATEDHDGTVPLLRYIGDSDRTAREHIADNHAGEHGDERSDRTAAERWVEDYLTEHTSAPSAEVKSAGARALGVSTKTIARAATKLGVISSAHGFPRVTHWSLMQSNTVDGQVVDCHDSEDSRDDATPISLRHVLTVPTGDDLHKRSVPTDTTSQSGQPLETRQHVVPTDDHDRYSMLCSGCGTTMSLASDRAVGHHGGCPPKPKPPCIKAPRQRRRTRAGQPIGETA